MKNKAGVIVYVKDPEGNYRFLLRHNKPFKGREDEWTILFGTVEENETYMECVRRELKEEYGIKDINTIEDLKYVIKVDDLDIHFYAVKVKDINTTICLNEESIGYDWMLIEDVKSIMKYPDEKRVFDILIENLTLIK